MSSLDVLIQPQVLNLFERLRSELGLSYLFVAHDIAMAAVSAPIAPSPGNAAPNSNHPCARDHYVACHLPLQETSRAALPRWRFLTPARPSISVICA